MIACKTRASASACRPPPRARAIADEMPPPIAPADSICIIMKPGKTSAMPASASMPRRETHQVSINPVAACANITTMFGQASRISVARDRRFEQDAGARIESTGAAALPRRKPLQASSSAASRGMLSSEALKLAFRSIYAYIRVHVRLCLVPSTLRILRCRDEPPRAALARTIATAWRSARRHAM